MATFSPSPAPRRSSRLRQPPTSPPRRLRPGNTSSRLGTPLRGNVNDSLGSVMDVDEITSVTSEQTPRRFTTEHLFAKSEQLSVSFYTDLPVEVSQILRNADFLRELYSGEIDTVTGFALITSAQTCYVWQHALALKGIPTCYIFPCPWDYNQTDPPFHCLVPHGAGREPGLILLSTTGEIRFWDSIGIGLAGGDRYTTTHLGLTSEELVTYLIRVDQQTYVASTTSGSLFRLVLTSTGGKYHIASHLFSKPSQHLSLSRLIPSIFSSASTTSSTSQINLEPGNVSSIALGATTVEGGREIWALVDSRVQKWDMKLDGWEEVVFDEDIGDTIRDAVRKTFGDAVEKDDAKMDLELVDVAIDGAHKLVVLVSYAAKEQDDIMAMDVGGIRRIYSLVQLSLIGDIFKIESVRGIPYQSTSSSGAPMHPRLQLLPDGLLVSIQFGDAVALCARESDYQERLELKSATDRTFGVGVMQSESVVLVLTSATMMKVNVNIDRVLTFDPENGRADLIKSIMTQAILYGSLPNNPLHFSFPPDLDEESLMQGAEQLSQAILESDPQLVRMSQDLTSQLKGRIERLNWLIQFINDNLVLVKMSQTCRQKLLGDAEKLHAALSLWLEHNKLLASAPTHSVLNDAVYEYMTSRGEAQQEDYMRAFFREHVGAIGLLVQRIPDITLNAAQGSGRGVADLLPEANNVVLTVLNAALQHREYNLAPYGIELPMKQPWTSDQAIIDGVLALFDTSTRVIEQAPERATVSADDLSKLATILFSCIQERLHWLEGSSTDNGYQREFGELKSKFDLLRPEVLETLRRNGQADTAFYLAERYRDFSSLAALCHRDTVFPPEENPNAARIQTYIDHFKEEFTTELYRWYIQHGELRVMFAQQPSHNEYLDKYFAEHPNPAISWIHDLGNRRHEEAATALLKVATLETNLETKQLMLSIGKLSQLAHLQESEDAEDSGLLDAFHDDLDFVSVHEALLDEFKAVLEKLRGKRSLDTQVDIIINERASTLSDRPELAHIFKNLVRNLLQGKSLSMEDAVDVLTLKDNYDTVQDYSTALHLLARCQLPEARKISAFRTVWRRIYIHDDWDAIRRTTGVTDAELTKRFKDTALYNTLLEILPREHEQEGYETVPDVALIIPTAEEIASRWPGMPQDRIERLIQDYNLECDKLGDLDLNDVYHRIRELAAEEIEWNHSG